MPDVASPGLPCVRVLNGMTRTIPHGQESRRVFATARRARLLGLRLQKVDEPLVIEGFERCEGSASLRADAGHVTAKEQSDSGGGVELSDTPRATSVVGDAADDKAAKHVVADSAAAVNSRGWPDSISRWSGWQHDLP